MDLHVFPILIPPPTSLSARFLWVFPVHQARELVSCIQPGLVICFTLDNIHVSMLFSRNIPPSPSPILSQKVETVTGFIFLGSKITAEGDCRHEIKRRLLLGRKAMINPDSVLKSLRHHFANKGLYGQTYGLSSSHVQM